jgi:DNA-binding transcriptional MerR regulator
MTSSQLCEAAGFTSHELQRWMDAGLLAADRVSVANARCREFADGQLDRIRVLKALHTKGVRLSRLARVRLDLGPDS